MTTAFVLSGGGSLGAVQVGMLQALARRDVQPDLLIGTSAGAVNAAYVAGHGTGRQALDELAATWRALRRADVFPFDPLRHVLALTGRSDSLCTDRGLRRLIEAHLPYRNLEDAAIPVHIVTTNVLSGEEVLLSDGDALSAVLASAAIPGVLPSVARDGLTLVDGGVADNAALSQAVALGADEIYVLPAGFACALAHPPASALAAAVHAITLLIEQRLVIEVAQFAEHARVKVLPPLCPLSISATDFGHADDLIRRAQDATGAWIDAGGPSLPLPERFLSLHHHRHHHDEADTAHVGAPCDHDDSRHPTATCSTRGATVPTSHTFVIVGAGLAGAKAAETLRDAGFDGRVVVLGDERERPYERPALSKEYLRGDAQRSKVDVHDASFYDDRDIELRTGARVVSVDPAGHSVVLDGGDRVAYDRLLLATGSAPRRLRVPGACLDGVHHLRTIADADRLSSALRDGGRVVVIGAGWIGCEVAASARALGRDVAMVDPNGVPLQRVLGVEVGAVYRDVHAGHGVVLHLGTSVESIGGAGRVEEVRLADGTRLAADLVVVGIGATPRVELAVAAGLRVDDGVVTDEYLRTSDPDVFAAGDVASTFHPLLGTHLRVEHWANALHQGVAAAYNMLDGAAAYDRVPYFFSDQYDLGMEYTGHATAWDRVVFRGDPRDGKFVAFWLDHGVVVAGMNVNVWDVTDDIQRLVRARVPVDPDRLADPDVPLDDAE